MMRILAVGHAQRGFGFGRVLSSLLAGLTSSFDVHQLELASGADEANRSHGSHGSHGSNDSDCSDCSDRSNGSDCSNASRPWTVHPNIVRGDSLGLATLPRLVRSVRPDLVFVVGEIWNAPHFLDAIARTRADVPVVAYCPIDGPLRHTRCVASLHHLACLVLYTEFGRSAVLDARDRLIADGIAAPPLPPMAVIPHGVDTETFRPLTGPDRRAQARAAIFNDNDNDHDNACNDDASGLAGRDFDRAFIVLNANRNTPRKRLDITIRGFAAFAAGKPRNVRLCLHTGVVDQGCNVLGVARSAGVLDRILLTERRRAHPQVSDVRLNAIYNACDVGVNTSGGEGWGLCTFEHAATAAAQVVPRHTACEELWRDAALLADATPVLEDPYSPVRLANVSIGSVAAALHRYYEDKACLDAMTQAAYRNATRRDRTWTAVSERFRSLFISLSQAGAACPGHRQPVPPSRRCVGHHRS